MSLRKMMPIVLSMVAALMLAAPAAVAQTTWYVDDDAAPGGSGTSWTDAFNDLQDALGVAVSGNEIWVAAGTYKPDGADEGNRSLNFGMRDGVAIYGGFDGTETELSERDYTANVTILSGDLGTQGDYSDNSYVVVFAWTPVTTGLLDGFTITGACSAGGLHCGYGAFTVQNCTVDGNTVGNDQGGAGMNIITGVYTVVNCVFSNNAGGSGSSGGAMKISDAGVRLTDCVFENNDAEFGGAIWRNDTGGRTSTIERCIFRDNTAQSGAGIFLGATGGDCTVVDCVFVGNEASSQGGGIYGLAYSTMTVTNCVFNSNWANGSGGGLTCYRYSPSLTNCTFTANSTNGSGGGVYVNSPDGQPILTNCIFWGNSDSGGTDETAQIDQYSTLPIVNYCLVQGLTGALGGVGNIDGNPLFVGADDLHLTSGSPAIDAGDNTAVSVSTDLDGNPRIVNDVDMGAYEFQGGAAPIDVAIDVKPGSCPNVVNLDSYGFVPIAILSSTEFDAPALVLIETIRLNGDEEVAVRGSGAFMENVRDVNDDGLNDLVIQVVTENLAEGSEQTGQVVVTGMTSENVAFEGTDEIIIMPLE